MFESAHNFTGREKSMRQRGRFVESHKGKVVKRKKKHTGARAARGHNESSKWRSEERSFNKYGTEGERRREAVRQDRARTDWSEVEINGKKRRNGIESAKEHATDQAIEKDREIDELRSTPISQIMGKIESLHHLTPQDIAEVLIEEDNGLFVLMNLKRIFNNEVDYNRLAEKFIETEDGIKTLANHLHLLPQKKILSPRIASSLVQSGYKKEVKSYPGYFDCSRKDLRRIYKEMGNEEVPNYKHNDFEGYR